MKILMSLLTLTILASCSSGPVSMNKERVIASKTALLDIEEVMNSSLSEEEKGMASMTIDTDPIIQCFSNQEGTGRELERLNIYRLDMGLTVAVWKALKSDQRLKVATNETDVADLQKIFKASGKEFFSTIPTKDGDVALQFGRNIPIAGKNGGLAFGKITKVNIQSLKVKTELICSFL